ncbi:MAG: DMT family transporter [Dehalococcoidia bacterium]|nr:DMT family transporter [Dehalococcoidia bacterium]
MGEAAALVAALTWSGTSVAMASIAVRTSPIVLSAIKLAAGSILLFVALVLLGDAGELTDATMSSVIAMLGSGLVAYALGDTIYIYTLGMLGVQRAFTVSMTLFISLTVLGGVVLLDEPFGPIQVVGTLLVGAGIWVIVRARAVTAAPGPAPESEIPMDRGLVARLRSDQVVRGYAIIVVVGILWTIATLWLAHGRGDLGSVAAASLRTPAGAAGLVVFAVATMPRELIEPFSDRRRLAAIVALGVVGTAFGSLAYVYSIGEAGAARATILSSVSPLMALPLSVIFLKERLTGAMLLGTVICVIGIILVVSGS